ncbi:hypothetical protein GNZ24_27110 [Burkholderia thailandensis]|nr:hypothetical protein [Burkholderia thailandensis]MUV25321.1 hypothetical protein [Burkholderia thailandensis]MUV30595.1 hypothetical protein [Burkholderia thailandensis]NBC92368.1 hypothetical protein [Burkholderia thailandensis]NBD01887.1 hypothetical protein [Burkholderia thailandensis]
MQSAAKRTRDTTRWRRRDGINGSRRGNTTTQRRAVRTARRVATTRSPPAFDRKPAVPPGVFARHAAHRLAERPDVPLRAAWAIRAVAIELTGGRLQDRRARGAGWFAMRVDAGPELHVHALRVPAAERLGADREVAPAARADHHDAAAERHLGVRDAPLRIALMTTPRAKPNARPSHSSAARGSRCANRQKRVRRPTAATT